MITAVGYAVLCVLISLIYRDSPDRYPRVATVLFITFIGACSVDHFLLPGHVDAVTPLASVVSSFEAVITWITVAYLAIKRHAIRRHFDNLHRIELQARRGADILRSLPLIVYEYPVATGRVTLSTGRGLEKTSYKEGDAVGHHILSFPLSMEEKTIHRSLMQGTPADHAITSNSDGHVFHTVMHSDGETVRCVVHDVTEAINRVTDTASREARMRLIEQLSM